MTKYLIPPLLLLVLAACSNDALGPSSDVPERPSFANSCSIPGHMSGKCASKLAQALAGFGGMLAVCARGLSWACVGASAYNSEQWNNFMDQPDANGISGNEPWPTEKERWD